MISLFAFINMESLVVMMFSFMHQLDWAEGCSDRNIISGYVWEDVSGRDWHLNRWAE